MVVNTPSGRVRPRRRLRDPRGHDRRCDKPIITTVQELAAAVQGIEAQLRGEFTVKSLQEHARDLDLYGRSQADLTGAREPVTTCAGVVQVTGELIATRRVGAYHHLTFVAPGLAELARPGQFVALAVGGDTSANLLRRCFSIHKVSPSGTYGGTVDIVVAAHGPGTTWLARLRAPRRGRHRRSARHGRSRCPRSRCPCVLVGGGYGTAPLFWLAEALRARGCQVEMVLGAATRDRLFGVVEAARASRRRHGHHRRRLGRHQGLGHRRAARGRSAAAGADVVYACGPMAMLRAVTDVAAAAGRRRPGRRRGVDGLRHRRVHDLRAAGRGDDGVTRVRALLRRGPGVPRPTGCAGTPTSARCRPTLSARRRDGGSLMAGPDRRRLAGRCDAAEPGADRVRLRRGRTRAATSSSTSPSSAPSSPSRSWPARGPAGRRRGWPRRRAAC